MHPLGGLIRSGGCGGGGCGREKDQGQGGQRRGSIIAQQGDGTGLGRTPTGRSEDGH